MSPPAQRPPETIDAAFFGSLGAETRFFIIRHGQSEGNAKRMVQGRLDLPLDAIGRSQAAALSSWLAAQDLDAIYASPLSRARETARILAQGAGLDGPQAADCFAELDTGIFSGLTLDEAQRRHPEAYAAFERQSWDGVPGAESSEALFLRAQAAWSFLRGRAEEGARNIAVVSHGGFIQWLVRTTFGLRSWFPLLPTGNCGVFELVVTPRAAGGPPLLSWRRLNYQVSAAAFLPQVF